MNPDSYNYLPSESGSESGSKIGPKIPENHNNSKAKVIFFYISSFCLFEKWSILKRYLEAKSFSNYKESGSNSSSCTILGDSPLESSVLF